MIKIDACMTLVYIGSVGEQYRVSHIASSIVVAATRSVAPMSPLIWSIVFCMYVYLVVLLYTVYKSHVNGIYYLSLPQINKNKIAHLTSSSPKTGQAPCNEYGSPSPFAFKL